MAPPLSSIEWRVSPGLTDYAAALAAMEARAAAIRDDGAPELVWLLEHPPVLTAGTSAVSDELIEPGRFPVHMSGRGGRYTYHGPGQRVGYVLLDLAARGRDVRCYVARLEDWLIGTLATLGVDARKALGRIGIWVDDAQGREAKIGAIGVRVRRWVTLHGFALNVAPDLTHFDAIVPCGIADYPVTSLAALARGAAMNDVDQALAEGFGTFIQSLGET
ncbi:lipoyl(octanoyl) transferase LipB [Sphingomonas nostoxanthinifaciens]|uniref:lipoyl(octanoyl) transferase LipB n=1 Tax=Sphingomonas nostoxanthinifaciens TaxID=2872652 RepID=UPI001CC210DB|nr:lipoyl(octanoyl) transferase LipB [Sphingomonas nostoxanthinifaciens]UAK26463.1 lipoyl(octanoyl) transferase LipB [Sphingomonas nostoxanthinifaciens]